VQPLIEEEHVGCRRSGAEGRRTVISPLSERSDSDMASIGAILLKMAKILNP